MKISYAQNFEDIMLWRALKHVPVGFYIDVGAWSPDVDSVTRTFYEAGWHGINIEPNATYLNDYQDKRARDTNLCLALSDESGEVEMYFITNSGLSTMKSNFANQHLQAGMGVKSGIVKVETLNSVWEKYVGKNEVHFLKIDVEGFELQVIKGNDWQKHRPWILIIEATEPGTQVDSYQDWEPFLLSNSYKMVYADGLNRFYLAEEHSDLLKAFRYPPNVFDDFLQASVADARKILFGAELNNIENKHLGDFQIKHIGELQTKLFIALNELDSMRKSASWKITKPLRALFSYFKS